MKRAAARTLLGSWPGGSASHHGIGDTAVREIVLGGDKAAGRVALVDDEDYDLVAQYHWHIWEYLNRSGRPHGPYAATCGYVHEGRRRTIKMHTLLTGWPKTDHANGNGLDNCRANLRPATQSQNAMNRRAITGCSSPYKGVAWNKRQGAWHAYIKVNGKRRHLGTFSSDIDGARAYDAAAFQIFGEYAKPNFPDSISFDALPQIKPLIKRSQYRGVNLQANGRWGSHITRNGKRTYLGVFATEIEAAMAYDAKARELDGPLARCNFPDHQAA